ncbi:Uma2 family endonuclease [Calycomorphotria hydatis]|uniref:Uma2 family endonuclease n=1 Tax=Calycomorphotria hydatis TaxID=2528027 RepID=UPI0018D2712D|nr:Uma2 family endonuclease [Calycomorphotria hydatis]
MATADLTKLSDPATTPSPEEQAAVPPLENGDRLTLPEFWRRFDAMPELKKAELIEGVVYLGSPVRHEHHGRPHFILNGALFLYAGSTSGVDGGDNSSLIFDLDNAPQPDVFLRVLPDHGGQTRDTDDGYIEGPPELVCEVAASSVSYDLHDKLNVYRKHGVREYVVWRTADREIDWFVLRDGHFVSLDVDGAGLFKSTVFPGLWLPKAALLAGDLKTVQEQVQLGLKSSEHQDFVSQLEKAKQV